MFDSNTNIILNAQSLQAKIIIIFEIHRKILFILIMLIVVLKSLKLYKKTLLSYRLKCRKNKENKNSRMSKTNKGNLILLSKFAVCVLKSQDLKLTKLTF